MDGVEERLSVDLSISPRYPEIKKEIVKHIFQFSASNLILQACLFIQNIFIANVLGPFLYGVFNGLQLILVYTWIFQLGAIDGLHREIPILRGEGKNDQIKLNKDAGLSFTLVLAAVASLILLTISALLNIPLYVKFGLICISFIAFLGLIGNFYGLTFRAENKFELVSSLLLINALIAILTIPLVIKFKFYGAFISLVLASAMVLAYARHKSRSFYSFKFSWNLGLLKPLIAVGLPITLLAYIAGLADTADRFIILLFLNPTKLGLYAAPKMIVATIGALITVPIASVFYPRFTEEYGRAKKEEDLFLYINKPISILCLVIPVFAGAIFVGLPEIVRIFLPAYTMGITAAKILLIGACLLAIFNVVGNFYPTIKKVYLLYVFYLLAAITNFVISYLLIRGGLDITGVAIGKTVAYIIYVMLLFYCAMYLMNKRFKQTLAFLTKNLLPVFYCFIIAVIISYIIPSSNKIKECIYLFFCKELIFMAATGWLLYCGWMKLNLLKENG